MLSHPLSDGVLHSHWTDVQDLEWPWKNFTPRELASKREGEFYWHARSFNTLQAARTRTGQPIYTNSAHRSWLHNLAVGGAPSSNHKYIAFDLSLAGYRDMLGLFYRILRAVGFTGFGFYAHFIHVDLGRGRFWFGSDEAKDQWMPIISQPPVEIAL